MVMVLVHMTKLPIATYVLRVDMRTNNVSVIGEVVVQVFTKTQKAIIMVLARAHNVEVVTINRMRKVLVVLLVLPVDIYRVVRMCRIIYPCHNVCLVVLAIIKVKMDLLIAIFVVQALTKINRENHHVKVVILATIQIKI